MRSLIHRLHIILFVLSLVCALSVINATYAQRNLFIALEHAQNQAQQLQQEASRLQYQQGALSKTSRIENIALRQLAMKPVQSVQTQYLQRTVTASASKPGIGPSNQFASARSVSAQRAVPATKQVALSKKQDARPAPSSAAPSGPRSRTAPTVISVLQIEVASLESARGPL